LECLENFVSLTGQDHLYVLFSMSTGKCEPSVSQHSIQIVKIIDQGFEGHPQNTSGSWEKKHAQRHGSPARTPKALRYTYYKQFVLTFSHFRMSLMTIGLEIWGRNYTTAM